MYICKKNIMKRFALKTNDGEVINVVKAEDYICATEIFANIKRLTVDTLLEIYDVGDFIR